MNIIPNTGRWNEISSILNDNFSIIGLQLLQMSDASVYNKGVHESLDALTVAYPTPMVGSFAYVGTTTPYTIYTYTANGWGDSGGQGVPTETNFSEITIATEEKPGLMSTNQVKTLKELGQTTAELWQATAEISKKVVEYVDVSELDGLVAIPMPANGKADYWLTKMSGGISIIIGRVFLFEDNLMHKVTQVVMSNQKIDDYYPDGVHAAEGLTVYYRFYGHNTVDVPLKQWTPWKKLYDSEDMSPDEIETAISNLQLKDKEHDDELQVIGDRVTTEINSIRSSTPVFANIVAGDVDLELSSVTSNYTVVYLENKKVFAALNAGKYWANWRAWGKYPSADSYGPAPVVGKVYIMGNALYVWNGSSLQEIGDFDDIKNNAQAIDLLAEEVTTKAPKVGYAPDLKVDFAKELVGRGVAEPQEIGTIRPTGVISIGDGNATIEKVKGKSEVWNQFCDFNRISTIVDVSVEEKTNNSITLTTSKVSKYQRVTYDLPYDFANRKVLISYNVKASKNISLRWGGVGVTYRGGNLKGKIQYFYDVTTEWTKKEGIYTTSSDSHKALTAMFDIKDSDIQEGEVFKLFLKDVVVYDLTQMFGAGNEPTTIEEFEARKPLGVSDEYNEGEIISYDANELKSVGFNAFNGTYAKVIGGQQYHALGTITSIGFTTELGGETTEVKLDSEGMFTPAEDGYVYAEGSDICIHLTHTYTPEHTTEYEEDILTFPDVKSIKDKDGNPLFPYGLLSAGSAHDEITATKAVKRIGVVDLGMLTYAVDNQRMSSKEYVGAKGYTSVMICNTLCVLYTPDTTGNTYNHINDKAVSIKSDGQISIYDSSYTDPTTFKQAMQGVLLYYELAEPIEVDLPEPLNLTYDAWDFGTEELIANGTTTPLNADIVYQFNAVDRIRENTAKNQEMTEEISKNTSDIATKQDELTLTILDNGNIRIGNLQGQTKDFMPATPSGDPMHYAYEAMGAEWNGGEVAQIKKITIPSFNSSNKETLEIPHLPNRWYYNALGDLTCDDMRSVYNSPHHASGKFAFFGVKARTTNFNGHGASVTEDCECMFEDSKIQTLYYIYGIYPSKTARMFRRNNDIEMIIGTANFIGYSGFGANTFGSGGMCKLREIRLFKIRANVYLEHCFQISKNSILYMINESDTTSAITITLHNDAYTRLANDADILVALAAKPLITLVDASTT